LQTKKQIQAILAEIGHRPRRRFGQNFLIDGNLLRLVAAAGDVQAADCVIEVGAGTGSLTEELLAKAGRVVAVEIDRNLAELLRAKFRDHANFTLIEGDTLSGKHSLNPAILAEIQTQRSVKLVANLPYQIASPLVIELLIANVSLLAFTVQKEVAQRLAAAAGTENYGPLSVMAQLLAQVEILRTLPPQAFWPMPKIESALVRMKRRDQLGNRANPFSRFVHAVFSYRRKMLRKALLEAEVAKLTADAALAATEISGQVRPERLSPEQWLGLFRAVTPSHTDRG
jgi:16S rRNA (adenine1518-N6/adenine1519-N6)-dimethyltransferase